MLVNMLPLADIGFYSSYRGPQLFLPKILKWKSNGLTLSTREYFECTFHNNDDYERRGITITDLNPSEIWKTVKEFIAIRDGKSSHLESYDNLQKTFWNTFRRSKTYQTSSYWTHPNAKIATSFLEQQHR